MPNRPSTCPNCRTTLPERRLEFCPACQQYLLDGEDTAWATSQSVWPLFIIIGAAMLVLTWIFGWLGR